MARDRPSKDRPVPGPIPEDEDLPLLYPEDQQETGGESREELYDPFAEDIGSDRPTRKASGAGESEPDAGPHDRGSAPEKSPMSQPPPPKPQGPKQGDEGERLHRLLDMEPTAGARPTRSADEANRSLDAAKAGGSVFEPAATPAKPHAQPGGARKRRPRPAGPQPEQSAETVFQPRKVADDTRSERRAPGDGLPEDPRDLPKVKPTYDRGREVGPIVITVAILVVLGMLAAVDGTVVGVPIMLAALAWGVYRLALVLPHPVRVTPEQAVREFYDAFCHRVPNYRRMYLLLSVPAKRDEQISSYRAFCAYWRWRQAQVVGKSFFEAVGFELERFDSKYNSQRTFAAVNFTLLLYRRGNPHDPLLVRPVSTTLVKGRDGSWYLNEGTLP